MIKCPHCETTTNQDEKGDGVFYCPGCFAIVRVQDEKAIPISLKDLIKYVNHPPTVEALAKALPEGREG